MASEEGLVIACHTKEEFKEQMTKGKEAKLVIIDFTAVWCGPCRLIAPVFADLSKKFVDAVFLKVDVDELKEVAEEYDILSMPTFLFFNNGQMVHKIVGARKDELQRGVEKHYSAVAATSSSAPA